MPNWRTATWEGPHSPAQTWRYVHAEPCIPTLLNLQPCDAFHCCLFFPELWPLRMWPSGGQPEGLQCERGHIWGDADSPAHVSECAVKNKLASASVFLLIGCLYLPVQQWYNPQDKSFTCSVALVTCAWLMPHNGPVLFQAGLSV